VKTRVSNLTKWELWVHYFLLEVILFICLIVWQGAMFWIFDWKNWVIIYLILAIGDQVVHFALHKLTGWED